MRLDELKQYTRLKADELYYECEIARLKQEKEIEISCYSSPSLTAIPSGGVSSPTERLAILSIEFAERIERQLKEAEQRLAETREKLKAIEDFVNGVEDKETRSMLRRHIKQRISFNQIANEFYVSRNYVAKRIKGVCD